MKSLPYILFCSMTSAACAAVIIDSYALIPNAASGSQASGSFPDTGGTELNDDIFATSSHYSDAAYSGYSASTGTDLVNAQPSIVFTLDDTYSLTGLTVGYYASNNPDLSPRSGLANGVGAGNTPDTTFGDYIEVSTSTDGISFSAPTRFDPYPTGDVGFVNDDLTFSVDLTGFSGSFVQVDFFRDHNTAGGNWLFLSEVDFEGTAIPEPSAMALVFGLGALALATTRRRKA